jgi:hypothetical protein
MPGSLQTYLVGEIEEVVLELMPDSDDLAMVVD